MRSIIYGVAALALILVCAGVGYYSWKFPYGWSHCCIIGMSGSVQLYAREHSGKYPSGLATPEASLGLLAKAGFVTPYELRGMIASERTVRAALARDGVLGPDSCGWNYVEGLTEADDPKLALLWCKQQLDHNGARANGRQVVFAGGGIEWISEERWPSFLREQEKLLKERSESAQAGRALVEAEVRLPDGTLVTNENGYYSLSEQAEHSGGSGSGSSSGNGGLPELRLWRAPMDDGSLTRTLSFREFTSEPVTVRFTNGVPDRTNVVFEMRVK